ncbi:MAG: ROK family protein [Chitinophagaceae bacterium]
MKQFAIGVDLGGTKIAIAIVDENGCIQDKQRFPTNGYGGYKMVLDSITNAIEDICFQNNKLKPLAAGIGVAGQIEKETGIVKYAPNLQWNNVSLQEDLKKKLDIPVSVCNDVKAATLGEWLYGAGKDCDNLVCVFVGTGIGGGIVSDGKMLEGSNNTAGEIGHITIDLHGPVCHCGNRGCFEALAGGWAIGRDVQKAVLENKTTGKLLLEIEEGDIKNISAKTLSKGLEKNDQLSKEIFNELSLALIAGAVSVVNAFGPSRLIFGGGVIEGMPQLLKIINEGVKKYALKPATSLLEILPAKLHNDAGVIGAAAFAFQQNKINTT